MYPLKILSLLFRRVRKVIFSRFFRGVSIFLFWNFSYNLFYVFFYDVFVGIVEPRIDLKLDIVFNIVRHDIISQCEVHVNIA
jgi:hypothetical protein